MLAVTGIGMVSSLGLDAVTGCAAARAGLMRAQELKIQITDRESQDLEPVVGHVVPTTEGFAGIARLLRLAQLALLDLDRTTKWRKRSPQQLTTWLLLPEADCAWKPLRDPPDPNVPYRNARQAQPTEYPEPASLVKTLGAAVGYAFEHSLTTVRTVPRTGFVEVLADCEETLAHAGSTDALIIAVDSLIDAPMVQHLFDDQRLKCADNPVGLAPGEGAVAVLVSAGGRTGDATHVPVARISGWALAADDEHDFSGQPPLGRGLARVFQDLHANVPEDQRSRWILSDLNGESRRAEDFGQALVRLVGAFPQLQQYVGTYPAASFGDTGVAGPAMALCWVARAFNRNYAPDSHAVVLSSAATGQRAGFRIEPGQPTRK